MARFSCTTMGGCSFQQLSDTLHLRESAVNRINRLPIVAQYEYRDAANQVVRRKLRLDPKDFRIDHPNGAGWEPGKGPAPDVLYRLPEVLLAKAAGKPVIVVEGEKDADRLCQLGWAATTNIEGASGEGQRSKWKSAYTQQLAGCSQVILIPDNDAAGQAHMQAIKMALQGKVADLRLLSLPGLPIKGDVSDWLNAGHAVSELQTLLQAAPNLAESKARGNGQEMPRQELPPVEVYAADSRMNVVPFRDKRPALPPDELSYTLLTDIQAEPVTWLWKPYIPLKANTLFCGDSDVGKSKAMASLIATVTRGTCFPRQATPTPAKNVIILSAEEDAASMLKPALLAAGVDQTKVALVQSCAEYDRHGRMRKRMVTLEKDVQQICDLALRLGNVGLVVIDPITAYLGTRIDSNNNTAIRAVLMELQTLAEATQSANVLITHPGKDTSRSAKTAVLGATAFVAGVRSVIGFFMDPDDFDQNRRLMIPIKCNLVPRSERKGIAFTIMSAMVTDGDSDEIPTAHVMWLNDDITQTAEEVRVASLEAGKQQRVVSQQREAVLAALRLVGEPMSSRSIAEAVYEEELPDWNDQRRTNIRRLLGKMLFSGQISQLPNKTYTLSEKEGKI